MRQVAWGRAGGCPSAQLLCSSVRRRRAGSRASAAQQVGVTPCCPCPAPRLPPLQVTGKSFNPLVEAPEEVKKMNGGKSELFMQVGAGGYGRGGAGCVWMGRGGGWASDPELRLVTNTHTHTHACVPP